MFENWSWFQEAHLMVTSSMTSRQVFCFEFELYFEASTRFISLQPVAGGRSKTRARRCDTQMVFSVGMRSGTVCSFVHVHITEFYFMCWKFSAKWLWFLRVGKPMLLCFGLVDETRNHEQAKKGIERSKTCQRKKRVGLWAQTDPGLKTQWSHRFWKNPSQSVLFLFDAKVWMRRWKGRFSVSLISVVYLAQLYICSNDTGKHCIQILEGFFFYYYYCCCFESVFTPCIISMSWNKVHLSVWILCNTFDKLCPFYNSSLWLNQI